MPYLSLNTNGELYSLYHDLLIFMSIYMYIFVIISFIHTSRNVTRTNVHVCKTLYHD